MAVPPPPDDPYGFALKVLRLAGEAIGEVFGWPDADEFTLRTVLAPAWKDLGALATAMGQAAGEQAAKMATSWPDFAGWAFNYSVKSFAGSGLGGTGELTQAADTIAQSVIDYAAAVEYTRAQIRWEIAINLPLYAATFATGPAGWAAGVVARFLISRGTARVVSGLLEGLATRAAASTFPRAVAMTPGKWVRGVGTEILDEETTTVGALAETGQLNTEFGRQQMEKAALGASVGEPLSHMVGAPFHRLANLTSRVLDRVGASRWVQQQGRIFVQSFGTNTIVSSVSSKFAEDVHSGKYGNLLNVQDHVRYFKEGWLSSGAQGTLRANGVDIFRRISQSATNSLINRFGADVSTFTPPPHTPPGELATVGGGQAGSSQAGSSQAGSGQTGAGQTGSLQSSNGQVGADIGGSATSDQAGGSVTGAESAAGQQTSGLSDAGSKLAGGHQPAASDQTSSGQGDSLPRPPTATAAGAHADAGPVRPGAAQTAYYDAPSAPTQNQQTANHQTADQQAPDQQVPDQTAADQQAADPQAADQQVADRQIVNQQTVDPQVLDQSIVDHQDAASPQTVDAQGNDLVATTDDGATGTHSSAGPELTIAPLAPAITPASATAHATAPPAVPAHSAVGPISAGGSNQSGGPQANSARTSTPDDQSSEPTADDAGSVRESADRSAGQAAPAADVEQKAATEADQSAAVETGGRPAADNTDLAHSQSTTVDGVPARESTLKLTVVREGDVASPADLAGEGATEGRLANASSSEKGLELQTGRAASTDPVPPQVPLSRGDVQVAAPLAVAANESASPVRPSPAAGPTHTRSAAANGDESTAPSGQPGGRGPIDPPPTSGDGATAMGPDDGPAADVEVGALSTDPDFAKEAQRAFVAAMNTKDDGGRYTPKAIELRERYYRRLATNQRQGRARQKGVVSRRGREGVLPEEMTFTATDGVSPPVEVPVPWVRQRGNGEVLLVDVGLGAKLEVLEVPFSDPVLKVTEQIMRGLQQVVDSWLASLGQPQASPGTAGNRPEPTGTQHEATGARPEATGAQPESGGAQPGAQIGALGEQFAEPMVHWLAARHPGEEIRPVHQEQDGAHTFDQIYARIHLETGAILGFVIIEAKNMNADIGQRIGLDEGSRYAQGHPGYVRSILAAMAAGEESAAVLSGYRTAQLQQALDNHTLEYFVARAQVDRSTGMARPKGLKITEYDMTLDRVAAPADADLHQGSTDPFQSTDTASRRPEGPVRRLGASEQDGGEGGQVRAWGANRVEITPDGEVIAYLNEVHAQPNERSRAPLVRALRRLLNPDGTIPGWALFRDAVAVSIFPADTAVPWLALGRLESRIVAAIGRGNQVRVIFATNPDTRMLEATVEVVDPSTGEAVMYRRAGIGELAERVRADVARVAVVPRPPVRHTPLPNRPIGQDVVIDGGPVRTPHGPHLTRSFGGNDVTRPQGPMRVGQAVVAVLRAVVPGPPSSGAARSAELVARLQRPLYDGRLVGSRFFGDAGLIALGVDLDPHAFAVVEEQLAALVQVGHEVTLTVTRVPRPGASPYRFTVEVTDTNQSDAALAVFAATELSALSVAIERGDQQSTNAVAVPIPAAENQAPEVQAVPAPKGTRLERNIQEAMARPSVAKSAQVDSIQQTGENSYDIQVNRNVVVDVVVTTGPVAVGQLYALDIQAGRAPTVIVTVAESLRRSDVAPSMAQLVAELGLRFTVGVTNPKLLTRDPVLTPTESQDTQRNLELTIKDRARLSNLAQRVEDRREMGAIRRALARDAIARLIESLGLATHQRDAELLRGLIGGRERAMVHVFEAPQSLLDRRLPQSAFVAKAVAASAINSAAIAAAVMITVKDPALAIGLSVPSFINALAGSFLDRWLVGKKELMYRPAYRFDDRVRERVFPGFRKLLGIKPAPETDAPLPPRATEQSNYVVRHFGAAAVGISAAVALMPLGVDPVSAIAILGLTAGFRAFAERLVDKGKFNSRLKRVDHLKRTQEKDPDSLQNQLLTLLADLRYRAERAASALGTDLDLRTPEPGDPPGFPSLGLHAGVQSIDQTPSVLRRAVTGNGTTLADILEQITTLQGLVGTLGPSVISGVAGAPVDAWFMGRDEAAGDARRDHETRTLAAKFAQEVLQGLGNQLGDLDQRIRQLEEAAQEAQPASTPDLTDRTQDRAELEEAGARPRLRPPDSPAGTRPFGLAPGWVWLAQVGVVSAFGIGGAIGLDKLDKLVDLTDLSFSLSVLGGIGAVIGMPVSRYYFKRAELRRFDRLNHALGSQVVDPVAVDRILARVQYLAEEIGELADQAEGAAPSPSGPVSRNDPDYTDRVRAAVREARVANLPGADRAFDVDVRQERSWGLQRIEMLATALDELVAAGRSGPEVDEARARLEHSITVYLRSMGNDGNGPFFPALDSVDPVLGRPVQGGHTDRVRAAVDEARRLLHAEPGPDKPLLVGRIDALWAIRKAADLVDLRAPMAEQGGNHRPLELAQRRLDAAIEKFRALSAEAFVPDALLIAPPAAEDNRSAIARALNPVSPANPGGRVRQGLDALGRSTEGGYDGGLIYSSEHRNRARWTFGQPGQPGRALLELREVQPPPPSYDDQAKPIPARRRVPFDWAFGHQAGRVIPPGVTVPAEVMTRLETLLQAMIGSGHAVGVTLTKVQRADGSATLEISVRLLHTQTGQNTLYRGRSISEMIDALANHGRPRPNPEAAQADQNAGDSTNSSAPSDPADPTDPPDPSDPSDPSDPTGPSGPTGPIDRTGPAGGSGRESSGPVVVNVSDGATGSAADSGATSGQASVQGGVLLAHDASGGGGPIRGVAESLLWFSGTRRLMADWAAVEREIHKALARRDVLEAAELESVTRLPSDPNQPEVRDSNWYLVKPRNGDPFEIIVRAGTTKDGHPGEFVVLADGTRPATITVSARSGDASVARTLANLLHQVSNAGRPKGPSVFRVASKVRDNQTVSREDGGRLAEARLLDLDAEPRNTSRLRLVRRQDLRNEMRALLEYMGLARGLQDVPYRRALLIGTDGPMVDKHTRGWVKGDERIRLRAYVAKELVFGGLPMIAGSIGMALATGDVAAAAVAGVPMLTFGVLHAFGQRWLDGHKVRVKNARYSARLGEAVKRNPGPYRLIEADPYGLAGKPSEQVDPNTMAPAKSMYRAKHLIPALAGTGLAWALAPTPLAFAVPAIFFTTSAVLRPLIDRFIDGRRRALEMLRLEEMVTRVATDPEGYQNQLADFFEHLDDRLTGATEAIARSARLNEQPGSLSLGTQARAALAEEVPWYLRRLVPGKTDPRELDPTELARAVSTFGEGLLLGAVANFVGALPAAGVNTVLRRKTDQADDALERFGFEVVDNGESRALFEALQGDLQSLVEFVELAERLAATTKDPGRAKLASRILDRFRTSPSSPQSPPSGDKPARGMPQPPAAMDLKDLPSGRVSFFAQTLSAVPAAVTLAGVNWLDAVLGLAPATYQSIMLSMAAQLLTVPVARWVANREDAKHAIHVKGVKNELAVDRRQLADKLGVLMFLREQALHSAQAEVAARQPQSGRFHPMNVARGIELAYRVRPTSADFTDYVRAAARAARLTIAPAPGQAPRLGFQERNDRHLELDRIEQLADRIDDLAEAVHRGGEGGVRANLREARAEAVTALDQLPALRSVDPATGARVQGNAIARTRAAVEEARRRLHGEPGSTPLRVRRLIALNRVGEVLEVLDRYLAIAEAGGSERGVNAALSELGPKINAFKTLQYRAGVAGDTRLGAIEVRQEIKAQLTQHRVDGNAAKLEGFVADGPVQDHAELVRKVISALQDRDLLRSADIRVLTQLGDGMTVEVTTRSGQTIVLRFTVGKVADGHPAAYRLTGGTEYAVVTVSDQIRDEDLARAIVHEVRELSRPTSEGAFTPHEQGRMGELLHLEQELEMQEYFDRPDPARRRLYQAKMQELVEELRVAAGSRRRAELDPAVRAAVERHEAERADSDALPPSQYSGPIRISQDQLEIHIIPRHAYGSPATGTKFRRDFDFDTLEGLVREVVERSPKPVAHNEDDGTFAHQYDFGPGVVIGASGTGRVRVWVDSTGNVRTVHPVDRSK